MGASQVPDVYRRPGGRDIPVSYVHAETVAHLTCGP